MAILPDGMRKVADWEINGRGFSGSDAYIAKAAHSEKMTLEKEKNEQE
jgi:hypothetical protein